MKKWMGFLSVVFLGFVACGTSNPTGENLSVLRMDDSGVTPAGVDAVVEANNRYAIDVYAALKQDGENIFLSPYSMSTALAMTYEGARGQTAEEIAQVFYFPKNNATRRPAFAALYNQLNEENTAYQLNVANALWAQKDYAFLSSYLHTLQNHYAAEATNLDFVGATEEARKTINTWVENRTNDKIKDLFPQGTLSATTRLVLTNAVYFKGQWTTKFDKGQTRNETFYTTPNQTVTVPMMRLTGKDVRLKYIESEGVQILEMPYKGEKLSMLIMLPENGRLTNFENALSLDKLTGWRNQMWVQRVDVFLPKFTFETKYFMNGALSQMGMPTAFSTGADFSGMDGTRNLAIQTIIHQAFVEVNEEGTEAAAATGVAVGVTSVGPSVPVFRADRPFLFVIQDVENGNILFMGRVVDPRG